MTKTSNSSVTMTRTMAGHFLSDVLLAVVAIHPPERNSMLEQHQPDSERKESDKRGIHHGRRSHQMVGLQTLGNQIDDDREHNARDDTEQPVRKVRAEHANGWRTCAP